MNKTLQIFGLLLIVALNAPAQETAQEKDFTARLKAFQKAGDMDHAQVRMVYAFEGTPVKEVSDKYHDLEMVIVRGIKSVKFEDVDPTTSGDLKKGVDIDGDAQDVFAAAQQHAQGQIARMEIHEQRVKQEKFQRVQDEKNPAPFHVDAPVHKAPRSEFFTGQQVEIQHMVKIYHNSTYEAGHGKRNTAGGQIQTAAQHHGNGEMRAGPHTLPAFPRQLAEPAVRLWVATESLIVHIHKVYLSLRALSRPKHGQPEHHANRERSVA